MLNDVPKVFPLDPIEDYRISRAMGAADSARMRQTAMRLAELVKARGLRCLVCPAPERPVWRPDSDEEDAR